VIFAQQRKRCSNHEDHNDPESNPSITHPCFLHASTNLTLYVGACPGAPAFGFVSVDALFAVIVSSFSKNPLTAFFQSL
jgi:hypothetical protein